MAVTRQFNTTDTIGRLMLNIPLSFAEFDCELDVERAENQLIASRRKRLRLHGAPPLAYDLKNRRLAINQKEAELVRWILRQITYLLWSGAIGGRETGTAFLTLIGTFLGALFAFRLNENREIRKLQKERKAALNRALFILLRQSAVWPRQYGPSSRSLIERSTVQHYCRPHMVT